MFASWAAIQTTTFFITFNYFMYILLHTLAVTWHCLYFILLFLSVTQLSLCFAVFAFHHFYHLPCLSSFDKPLRCMFDSAYSTAKPFFLSPSPLWHFLCRSGKKQNKEKEIIANVVVLYPPITHIYKFECAWMCAGLVLMDAQGWTNETLVKEYDAVPE